MRDAADARAYLIRLLACSLGLPRLSQLTGLSVRTLRNIRHGHQRVIRHTTAEAILNLQRPSLAAGQVVSRDEAYRTRERLRTLRKEGYSARQLAGWLGRTPALERAQVRPVRVSTWRRVRVLFEQLTADSADARTE